MPTISDYYHDNLIETMKDLANNTRWFASSINLGGVPGSGGGSGGPPGGFYGQLIQSQVAYDTTEAAVQGGPVGSGWSLVDNLNHIRYSILNSQSLPLVIQDEGTLVASGVPILNFTGPGVTASLTGSSVTIAVTGSGGGGETGTTVIWQDCTSQVPAAGDNYTISQPAISGTIKVFLNGLLQKPTNITQTSTSFHTTFSAVSGDELVATYLASGIPLASGIIVYDDGVLIASGVFKLNFADSLVTYAGGIATISGMSPDTKKVKVVSTDTTENYLETKIRPGNNITVTTVSGTGNAFLQINSTASGNLVILSSGVSIASGVTSINFAGGLSAQSAGAAVTVAAPAQGNWYLIQDTVLSSDTANITFSNIPTSYKHLILFYNLRTDYTSTTDAIKLTVNDDPYGNYDCVRYSIAHSAALLTAEAFNQTSINLVAIPASGSTANFFASGQININDYANTTGFKNITVTGGSEWTATAGNAFVRGSYAMWKVISGINKLIFSPNAGAGYKFKQNSRISLYGVN